ncbi:MAG: CBS domain-containing protein, partial [Rhodobacteraceae bacterium]|nr:CBS domain-containing protein [Paracoccaceae bacterium]
RRMRVEDVMIPRAEIVSVSCEDDLPALVKVFRDSGMTRLPVYEGTLDSPLGLVHLKDVALRFGFDGKQAGFSLRTMLRPLLFVPPSMPIGVQRDILKGSFNSLATEGSFVQFTYGPNPSVHADLLKKMALSWTRSDKIWLNLPPARVYRFTRHVH